MVGKYDNIKLKYNESTLEKPTISVDEKIGIFEITREGRKIIVAAKGHKVYVDFIATGKYSKSPCKWCRRKIKGKPIGLPVGNIRVSTIDGDSHIICYIEDLYDTFECLYAAFKLFYSRKKCYRESEEMIFYLFDIMHPNEILIPANDWRTLISNEGWMTDEEFSRGTHHFVDTGRILMVPTERIYELIE
uniref:A1L transcription factor/late transcription factor VLTF-2 n=1 Tax=Pithovirus LCPAC403 TaxID=2506596 RepID=A0A481ZCR0_9VIRU|nr:MAG: A1L transcription factor/late transcription factor VLTF-2 [Pithovirus LCPAC403]